MAVYDDNEFPQESSNVPPQLDRTTSDSHIRCTTTFHQNQILNNSQREQGQQQAFLTEHEKQACLSSSPSSTTNDSNNIRGDQQFNETNNSNSNGSDNHLMRYEASLRAVERMQHQQKSESEEIQKIQAINNTQQHAVTQAVQIQQLRENEQPRQQEQQEQQQQQQQQGSNEEVIELLDDDDGETDAQPEKHPQMAADTVMSAGVKRSRPLETNSHHYSRPIVPGSNLNGYQSHNHQYARSNNHYRPPAPGSQTAALSQLKSRQQNIDNSIRRDKASEPRYIRLPPNHIPTWDNPLPPLLRETPAHTNQHKHFELSLLNVSEFTITGLPVSFDGRPSSVLGFRKIVKEVSRGHGKAVFERDVPKENNDDTGSNFPSYTSNVQDNSYESPDGGKWRIPLVRSNDSMSL